MPRYFLNIYNGQGPTIDDEGVDLPDANAARNKAIEGIRSILSEEIKTGAIDLGGRIDIVDDSGTTLAEVPFTDALRIVMPGGAARQNLGATP